MLNDSRRGTNLRSTNRYDLSSHARARIPISEALPLYDGLAPPTWSSDTRGLSRSTYALMYTLSRNCKLWTLDIWGMDSAKGLSLAITLPKFSRVILFICIVHVNTLYRHIPSTFFIITLYRLHASLTWSVLYSHFPRSLIFFADTCHICCHIKLMFKMSSKSFCPI